MFKIKPSPTFNAVVKVPVPGGETADLAVVFKHKTRDEVEDFFSRARAYKGKDAKLLTEIISGWTGVDAEFSEDSLNSLVQNYHGAVRAIFDAYLAELSQAKAGN